MKNLTKEKRDRLILVALGTIMLIVALWYGLISAQKKSIVEIALLTEQQKTKVSNAERLVHSTGQIQKDLEITSQKLKSIEDTMASGDMYSWIIQTVNNFLTAKNYRAERKVDIPQFSREVPAEVGVLTKFPYKAAIFNVRGTAYFHDFGKFLADFENSFPYIRVQNLELESAASTSATTTSDPEKLAFKMEIVTLVSPNLR